MVERRDAPRPAPPAPGAASSVAKTSGRERHRHFASGGGPPPSNVCRGDVRISFLGPLESLQERLRAAPVRMFSMLELSFGRSWAGRSSFIIVGRKIVGDRLQQIAAIRQLDDISSGTTLVVAALS